MCYKFCEECNEEHHCDSFCKECGECLKTNSVLLTDDDCEIHECKCGLILTGSIDK